MYQVLISSAGIVVGLVTLLVQSAFYKVKDMPDVEQALKVILVISTVLMTPVVLVLSKLCLPEVSMGVGFEHLKWWYCAVSTMLGLWSGLIISYVTEYCTSASYTPMRAIAETQKSAAKGIIYCLALGYIPHRASTLLGRDDLGSTHTLRHIRRGLGCLGHAGHHVHGPHHGCLRPHLGQRG